MKRILVIVFLLSVLGVSTNSEAAVTKDMTYSENIIWRCAVRFVRIDNGFSIIEKDKDAGYLMFEYTEGGRKSIGSIEIFNVDKSNKKYVKVQVSIQQQPKYIESLLFKKLERKLKTDYGIAPEANLIEPELVLEDNKTDQKQKKAKEDEFEDATDETDEGNED